MGFGGRLFPHNYQRHLQEQQQLSRKKLSLHDKTRFRRGSWFLIFVLASKYVHHFNKEHFNRTFSYCICFQILYRLMVFLQGLFSDTRICLRKFARACAIFSPPAVFKGTLGLPKLSSHVPMRLHWSGSKSRSRHVHLHQLQNARVDTYAASKWSLSVQDNFD